MPDFSIIANFVSLFTGRFGNQAEHYIGAMAFAKAIDRTLVLPPFRTYVSSTRSAVILKIKQSLHQLIVIYLFPNCCMVYESIGPKKKISC